MAEKVGTELSGKGVEGTFWVMAWFCILIRVLAVQGSAFIVHLRFVHFMTNFTSKEK